MLKSYGNGFNSYGICEKGFSIRIEHEDDNKNDEDDHGDDDDDDDDDDDVMEA